MTDRSRPWSCDTFAVRGQYTVYGATVLGKNSDRPVRESQPLHTVRERRGGGRLQLAYVEVDDAAETIAHVGSSPYWCWGHESGVNAAGVAIGNEAVFTRDAAIVADADRSGDSAPTGILGMELLRLGLERAHTAERAVEVMTGLVERYGQYGAGTVSTDRPSAAYDNSYLVADNDQVWVLETSGRRWVAKRVEEPSWALSNEPTVRSDYDRAAADLDAYARQQGWHHGEGPVDFAGSFTDPQVPLQVSHIRLQRARQLLADALKAGAVGFTEARTVLSDHYEGTFLDGPKFNPAHPDFHTLCMHAHPSGFTWGNTASSMIAVLRRNAKPYLWWAATTPCTSVYVPVLVTDEPLPAPLSTAGTAHGTGPCPERAIADGPRSGSYWWTFQRLLEAVTGEAGGSRYRDRQPKVRERFDRLQQRWLGEVEDLATSGDDRDWHQLTERCLRQAEREAAALLAEFGVR